MRILALIAISSFLISCKKKSINCGLECGSPTEELLFQTSFTNTIITDGEYKNANFSGTDPAFSEKSDWDSFKAHDNIGYVEIGYEDGENNQRLASVVDDPDSTGNSVLKFQLMEASIKEGSDYKGRVQLSVHDNKCIKELYQTVKLKFHPDMAYFQERADRLYWFTLFEFWNNGAWTKEKYPFRVSVNLYKDEGVGSDINFRVKADYKTCKTCKWNEVWGETATASPIIYGEWMEIEIYLKEGDDNNGKFYMSVTPEGGTKTTLFDISNTTHHPKEKCADGFTHFETMKVYTSQENIDYMNDAGKELSLFWDDWKFYINKTN
jgi:hypothetical protein